MLLDAAVAYATRGWRVFPCSQNKAPRTPHGVLDATTDTTTIRAWWTKHPAPSIGIATGQGSGLVVLDVDPRHGGDDALAELGQQYRTLPATPRVITGGGGTHIYLRHPGSVVPCSTGRLGRGLDVRGAGGYVIAPPSGHASGRSYIWMIGYGPDDVPLAATPPWLLGLIASTAGHRLRRNGTALVIPFGERNATLARFGGLLRRYGLNAVAIRDALTAINREHCTPSLPANEVERIAASVSRYTPALLPPLHPFRAGTPADALVARALGLLP
ncbi:MAG TPA: bifunctional DNA primase/polymerase [Candidatus Binatia bacterium]|nr:bifunctional DNA primase/polymerase [Candidatus Binatia bacterium]